jgi:1-deoxy-D-xylulose-5-phosphate reductoisomerase
MARAAQFGTTPLPVDSEHNAIFQVLNANAPIRRIVLTASGGPFLDWPLENIAKATLEEALKHPNWVMGPKITIDSASMMNKGLEVIEARYLFGLPPEKIEVLIHPQSLVHGMVEYEDGSVLCQMGASDMRTPIAHILGWPERISSPGRTLDWETLSTLTFRKPDLEKFPALGLAYRALEKGPGACLALNAANEVMVEEFLQERCGFLDIVEKTSTLIDVYDTASPQSLDDVEEMDRDVRARLKCDILNHNQKLAGKL